MYQKLETNMQVRSLVTAKDDKNGKHLPQAFALKKDQFEECLQNEK